ncbi:STM1 [Cyberlindnera jadinii]|uniref:STM1 protein n=1 Tax=Cyberlindnera jadinii (strain ATCC 18201 / CBS 1600 / BCRC 20928 / JCM 3617 / NBRC 0987 / NRRL Y-1542) TaxID=983966 RepID=A0A0H5CHM3_CYBJN|nr:STM1 [Cyberlindnera jadinii]
MSTNLQPKYFKDVQDDFSPSNGDNTTFQPPQEQEYISTPPIRSNIKMSYAKVYDTQPEGFYQSMVNGFGSFFGSLGIIPCCCCSNPYTDVKQGTVGLVTKFGELARVVDPGSTYVNIFSEKLYTVSIKTEVQEIPSQVCMTKDNVNVGIKSVVYYNIVDPQKAVFGISDISEAISERTQTTLRDVIGARLLQDVIERREEIAEAIEEIIQHIAADWGVSVESILIKDLQLDSTITNSLSQAAQAKRIGESKIITAKAEVESAKLMRQAADILASKPAMQIRYLDAMQNMARSSGSKVIFMPSSGDVEKAASDVSGTQYETSSSNHAKSSNKTDMIAMQEALS